MQHRVWGGVLRIVVAAGLMAGVATRGFAAEEAADDETFRVEWNLVYATPDGTELRLDAYVPHGDGPFPAVLVVHGGAWRMGSKAQLAGYARALARRGYAAFAINYRLAPDHKFPAQIDDCRSAVRWIRRHADRYHVDPDRLGAIGYSAGGHLVALLGVTAADGQGDDADTRLQCVCAGGAPCEFRTIPPDTEFLAYWLGGSRSEVPDHYRTASPLAFVTKDAPPTYFFHGEDDLLVPIRSPRAMADALTAAGVETEFHAVAGSGHILAMIDHPALDQAWRFFDRHLK